MKLRITAGASSELRTILRYISQHSHSGAQRVQLRIKTSFDLLVDQPFAGHETDADGLRRLIVRPFPYVIFYEVAASEIIIISIRHGARDPAGMPDAEPDA